MQKAIFSQPTERVDEYKAFNDGFGEDIHLEMAHDELTPNKIYWDPINRVDRRSQAAASIFKAGSINTQTGGAGTAGTAMVPVWVDPNIVDRTVREQPLLNIVQRRAMKGGTYDYVPLTNKAGAVFRPENATIVDQEDTYTRESVPVKYLYAKGRVSGPSIAQMRGFVDPQALDLSVKTTSMFEALENAIINGDASTTPAEFNGLITSITTNTTNLSTSLPTLAQLRAEMAASFNSNGQVTLGVTDKTTHNYIKSLLLDLQRNVTNPSQAVMGFGIKGAFEFDDVMFIPDKFMPTASGSRRILFLDLRYIFLAVLQDMTYEEKYNEDDNYPFLVKWYGCLVVTHEAACTQMYGIA